MDPMWSFLLISGHGEVVVLYWASDGAMLLCFVQVVFWVEFPIQRRLCPIFVKLWVIKGTQQCDIGLPDIHKFFAGWQLVNGPPGFGASQVAYAKTYQSDDQ